MKNIKSAFAFVKKYFCRYNYYTDNWRKNWLISNKKIQNIFLSFMLD
jgi:hypothetical protein